jgi:CheY-like chemotaxis protein
VPDQLIGDPWRLKQLIVNLAGNAIKFTNQGKILIAVDVAAPEQGEAVLHFTVTDTGIGIPQKDLQAIFEPFRQGDGSSTRKYGGAGLGLAISAHLSALMNGQIWAESEPGKGSAFHFTARMGIAEPHASIGAGRDPSGCDLEDIRVLVVDGDAASRRAIQEMLSSWRMSTSAVDGFEAALRELDQAAAGGQPFTLAILDAEISGGRGLELAESIQARAGAIRPAILILTSTAPTSRAETLQALGIGACLRKPVQQCELMDAITTTLASESLQRLGAFSSQPSSEPREAPAAIDAARVRNILAAEDNLVNQRLLLRMLQKRGHSVVMVSNGREAVEALIREKFDLVLLDIQMPEMSGLEATAAIRAREVEEEARLGVAAHIPIIAVTANAMKGDRERYLAAGMDGYIAKPVHPQELFETVENLSIIQVSAPEITFDSALFEGDLEFLAEIVNLFLETYPALLSAIEDAVSRKDAEGLCRAAHTLKGAVANFGAKAVVEQARALEMIGKNGDLSSADEGWRRLRALMAKLIPELQAALERATEEQVVM